MKRTLLVSGLILAFLGLLIVLFTLNSCWFYPAQTEPVYPLQVVATPTGGHPSLEDGGLLVEFSCGGGTYKYGFTPGDGGAGFSSATGHFSYTYKTGGVYEAIITSGGESKTILITVLNEPPTIYMPFTLNPGSCYWMERKLYDARYQERGCTGGLLAYGVCDRDGDPIAGYRWDVRGPGKTGSVVTYSVFDSQGDNITGQTTDDPLMVFFPGWTEADPPYPFLIQAKSAFNDLAIEITQTSWDLWGGESTLSWTIKLVSRGCSQW